jgi:hypothetical protein
LTTPSPIFRAGATSRSGATASGRSPSRSPPTTAARSAAATSPTRLGDELAYVWIGKPLSDKARFTARWRWYSGGKWSEIYDFSDGSQDAWHTNVERRPDGSVLAGWDIGSGGSATTLYVAEGRAGQFSKPENLTATGKPGERPHFAFGKDGVDHVTWFHKEGGQPIAVYVRSGRPGAWGPVDEPSAGLGGFHFDPDVAINDAGVRLSGLGLGRGARRGDGLQRQLWEEAGASPKRSPTSTGASPASPR